MEGHIIPVRVSDRMLTDIHVQMSRGTQTNVSAWIRRVIEDRLKLVRRERKKYGKGKSPWDS